MVIIICKLEIRRYDKLFKRLNDQMQKSTGFMSATQLFDLIIYLKHRIIDLYIMCVPKKSMQCVTIPKKRKKKEACFTHQSINLVCRSIFLFILYSR